mgnify:CR=1 FL=1
MKSPICEMLGAEFPLVAFSHCKDVVVAVSKAGGVGVLGAVGMSPEILEQELKWIDERIDGMPYGVDVLIPNKMYINQVQLYKGHLPKKNYQESFLYVFQNYLCDWF